MKRPPFLRLILLPALLIPVQAQPPRIHCRFVSIEKSGTAAALQSLPDSGLSDSQLFESLMREVAQGHATIVADQQTVLSSGTRSKVEAVRSFPVPLEAGFEAGKVRFYPDFAGDGAGQVWEMEGMVTDELLDGVGVRGIDLNMAPQAGTFLQRIPSPLSASDAGRKDVSGPLPLPLMADQKTAVQLLTWTGNTVLISVSPGPADSLMEGGLSCRYQFVRAGLDGEKPVPPGSGWTVPGAKSQQARLHLVTFRLPAAEAVSLTLNAASEKEDADAALFQQLRSRVSAGSVRLAGSSAVITRIGQRSKVESCSKYPIIGPAIGGSSVNWEHHNMGETVEAELSRSDERHRPVHTGTETRVETYQEPDGKGPAPLAWHLTLERANGLEEIPAPSAPEGGAHAGAADVEYLKQVLATQVIIPRSGILRIGLISGTPATAGSGGGDLDAPGTARNGGITHIPEAPESPSAAPENAARSSGERASEEPEYRGEAMTDITFALQSPAPDPAGADSREATDQVEYQAFMLSLPSGEGRGLAAALKTAGAPLPAGNWMGQMRSGAVPCAAQAAVVSRIGRLGKISAVRNFLEVETSAPNSGGGSAGAPPSPSTPTSKPPSSSRDECGFLFAAEGSLAEGQDPGELDVNVEINWDTAPLLSQCGALSQQADHRASSMAAAPRRCTQKISLHSLALRRGQPDIADVRASNARPGAPEHGRWHALLLIAR